MEEDEYPDFNDVPAIDVLKELIHPLTMSLAIGDVVTDVVLVARVMRADDSLGVANIVLSRTDNTDQIVQTGLLHAAVSIDDAWYKGD